MIEDDLLEATLAVDRFSAEGMAERLRLLKAVADPTRLGVLDRLAAHGERCHCDLESDLGVPANRMSFHLKVLREAGIVEAHRVGKPSAGVRPDRCRRRLGVLYAINERLWDVVFYDLAGLDPATRLGSASTSSSTTPRRSCC
jgi:DNA-binding transcriptional ArsR family regulator